MWNINKVIILKNLFMSSRREEKNRRHVVMAVAGAALGNIDALPISGKAIESIPPRRVGEKVAVARKVIKKADSFQQRQKERQKEGNTLKKGEKQQRWRDANH